MGHRRSGSRSLRRLVTGGLLVVVAALVAVPAGATATTTDTTEAPATGDAPTAHAFDLTLDAEEADCTGKFFGAGIGSCQANTTGTTTSPFTAPRIDWQGKPGGSGPVGVSILSGYGDVLQGTMSSRGSDSLAITAGSVQFWDATTGISTGTSKPAGQVDGPLQIDVRFSDRTGFTFRVHGFLVYGNSSSGAVPTTTALVALPTASPGQAVTYRATVSPTTRIAQSYGTFEFSFTGRVRKADNCYHPLEDNSGRAACTVTFASAGNYTVTAEFRGTADRAPSSASVPQVIDDAPSVTTSVAELRFPFRPQKETLPQSVALTWTGKLVVSSVDVTGAGFRVTGQDCTDADLRKPCTVDVSLTANSGVSHGELVITDNASDSPQRVALSG